MVISCPINLVTRSALVAIATDGPNACRDDCRVTALQGLADAARRCQLEQIVRHRSRWKRGEVSCHVEIMIPRCAAGSKDVPVRQRSNVRVQAACRNDDHVVARDWKCRAADRAEAPGVAGTGEPVCRYRSKASKPGEGGAGRE